MPRISYKGYPHSCGDGSDYPFLYARVVGTLEEAEVRRALEFEKSTRVLIVEAERCLGVESSPAMEAFIVPSCIGAKEYDLLLKKGREFINYTAHIRNTCHWSYEEDIHEREYPSVIVVADRRLPAVCYFSAAKSEVGIALPRFLGEALKQCGLTLAGGRVETGGILVLPFTTFSISTSFDLGLSTFMEIGEGGHTVLMIHDLMDHEDEGSIHFHFSSGLNPLVEAIETNGRQEGEKRQAELSGQGQTKRQRRFMDFMFLPRTRSNN